MSEVEKNHAEKRLESNSRALGQLWARLAGDANLSPEADVLYMHGLSPGMVESCGLFSTVEEFIHHEKVPFLAYNGSDGRGAGKDSKPGQAWPGEAWYRSEFRASEIPDDKLCPTRPGLHTRDETDAFVELAKARGWKTAYVATVVYHWPRSLSCLVASMAKYDWPMKLWFAPPPVPPVWNFPMEGSQGVLSDSTYGREAGDDVTRLFSYWDKGREDNGEAWRTRFGAPPEVVHHYLNWRDGI